MTKARTGDSRLRVLAARGVRAAGATDVTGQPASSADIQELYLMHGRTLLAYGVSLLGSAASAEDVLHQVFARLLRGNLAIDGPPLPYLCRAVRNAASNHRRGQAREVALDPHAAWLEAPRDMVEIALALQQSLEALPSEQREVIVLHVWGSMTFLEVGDALDISPNTAASRYRYGLRKMRELFTSTGSG